MPSEAKITTTSDLLSRAKRLAPDRVPKPDRATAEAWASALDRQLDQFPLDLWRQAVELWATELVGDRMITPRELKGAAYSVRDRWEADPARRTQLSSHRDRQRDLRDRQLKDGSFSALRGYVAPSYSLPAPESRRSDRVAQIGE